MPQVNKIDSNITGLAIAKEATLGYLPGENGNAGTPVWWGMQPNSYSDFGGENSMVAPNPINPDRQRRKGTVVDLDANGGFNHNWSFFGLKDILPGAFFANIRGKAEQTVTAVDVSGTPDLYMMSSTTGFVAGSLVKGWGFNSSANNGLHVVTAVDAGVSVGVADTSLASESVPPANAILKVVGFQGQTGDITISASGDFATIASTLVDFTTLGLVPGQWIYIGGDNSAHRFATAANNGYKRIRSISANAIVVDKSAQAMVDDSAAAQTIRIYFGDVLKNELGTDIVRHSYQLERTLGVPNTDNPSQVQSEVIVGAVLNEVTINAQTAELMTVDFSYLGIDNVQRTASEGPKQANVQRPRASQDVNTTSDVKRIKMHILSSSLETVPSLFGFVTEATFTINNNVTPDKAIGVLGAFDMSTGTFQVGGNVNAYFSTVEAVQAVRNSADVTIDMIVAKDNQGWVLDLPLIALGDGRLNVEQDTSIQLPLSMEAASGVDIHPNFNYTAMITFFWYLPTVAM